MTEPIRAYLNERVLLLIEQIDNAYEEIENINRILRDLHKAGFDAKQVGVPGVLVPPIRPPLVPAQSFGDVARVKARQQNALTPPPLHPAHRSGVNSQSKPLSEAEHYLNSHSTGVPFKLQLDNPYPERSYFHDRRTPDK